MKEVIINADDFGLSKEVNEGIIESHTNGIVTSASLMMTMSAVNHAVTKLHKYPNLDVGIHLDLTWGKALSDPSRIPSLTNSCGDFVGKRKLLVRLLINSISQNEIEREISAQINAFKKLGIKPYHADVHQHFQCIPVVMKALMNVAIAENIPFVRLPFERVFATPVNAFVSLMSLNSEKYWKANIKKTDYFIGLSLTDNMNETALIKTFSKLKSGLIEVMCHPGYEESSIYSISRLQSRDKEVEVLTSSQVKDCIQSQNIKLTTFREQSENGWQARKTTGRNE